MHRHKAQLARAETCNRASLSLHTPPTNFTVSNLLQSIIKSAQSAHMPLSKIFLISPQYIVNMQIRLYK